MPPVVKVAAVVFVALLVQVGIVTRIEFWGVSGDLLVVLAVAAGFAAGPERGAVIGFVTGLSIDLILTTPLGLTALVFTVTAYVSGLVGGALIRSSKATAVGFTALAAPASVGIWVVVGALLGQSHLLEAPLLAIAAMNLLVAVVTIPAMLPLLAWAVDDPHDPVRYRR